MLRNREEEETSNLRGVITAVHDEDIKLGQFTSLENWIPSKVTTLKKKRGGVLFTSAEVEIEEPVFCASFCTDTSERGQQIISIETAFDQATTFGGGALHTSWGHINGGELYSLIGLSTCGGGNMTYNNTCCQINHYIDDVSTLEEGILLPVTTAQPFVNTLVGTSDRPVWATNSTTGVRAYYELGTVKVDYATPETNGGANTVTAFAIQGNEVWFYTPSVLDAVAQVQFSVFNRTTGVKTDDFYSFGNTDDVVVWDMHLTTDYLYCLGSLAGVIKLYKINRSDGVIAGSFTVTALEAVHIGVASDDLIYLFGASQPVVPPNGRYGVYYIKNFSTLVFVGYVSGADGAYTNANGTGLWNNGTFYFGDTGRVALTNTDVSKVEIPCLATIVSPLLIASVTAQAAVVAGNNLSFSWADILLPSSTDTIVMKPAPAAGVLGLTGSTVATFTNASALTDGSSTLAVPGGTTPGNYVLMYASTIHNIWTATSNVFTVT